jgi:hypothetical protein
VHAHGSRPLGLYGTEGPVKDCSGICRARRAGTCSHQRVTTHPSQLPPAHQVTPAAQGRFSSQPTQQAAFRRPSGQNMPAWHILTCCRIRAAASSRRARQRALVAPATSRPFPCARQLRRAVGGFGSGGATAAVGLGSWRHQLWPFHALLGPRGGGRKRAPACACVTGLVRARAAQPSVNC